MAGKKITKKVFAMVVRGAKSIGIMDLAKGTGIGGFALHYQKLNIRRTGKIKGIRIAESDKLITSDSKGSLERIRELLKEEAERNGLNLSAMRIYPAIIKEDEDTFYA